MPFVSNSQRMLCYAKKDPNWDCSKWSKETPNIKDLPYHKKKKKQIREFVEFLEDIDPALAKTLKDKEEEKKNSSDKNNVYDLKKSDRNKLPASK